MKSKVKLATVVSCCGISSGAFGRASATSTRASPLGPINKRRFALTAVGAVANPAARRVRWAPVLAAMRAVEVPAAEVQLKQQAWQAIKAGKPAAEAAADAEDAMELEAQAEAEAAEARRAVRAESGKRQAVAGTPDEAAQAQAGMAGVEARSWAAVAAGGSGATRTPAGKRAQHISRPSAGVTRPTTRAAATAATAAVAGMGRELQRAWRAAQGAKAA